MFLSVAHDRRVSRQEDNQRVANAGIGDLEDGGVIFAILRGR